MQNNEQTKGQIENLCRVIQMPKTILEARRVFSECSFKVED